MTLPKTGRAYAMRGYIQNFDYVRLREGHIVIDDATQVIVHESATVEDEEDNSDEEEH